MGGIVNDILYDHLLWKYEHHNQTLQLNKQIIRFYKILDDFCIDPGEHTHVRAAGA